MSELDWEWIEKRCAQHLRRSGIRDDDRTADAVYFVWQQVLRNPEAAAPDKFRLTVWRAAKWAAEGRTPARHNPVGYVDALNPCDARKRAAIVAAQTAAREAECAAADRRAALAELFTD